jgi:hypothetical protein
MINKKQFMTLAIMLTLFSVIATIGCNNAEDAKKPEPTVEKKMDAPSVVTTPPDTMQKKVMDTVPVKKKPIKQD